MCGVVREHERNRAVECHAVVQFIFENIQVVETVRVFNAGTVNAFGGLESETVCVWVCVCGGGVKGRKEEREKEREKQEYMSKETASKIIIIIKIKTKKKK